MQNLNDKMFDMHTHMDQRIKDAQITMLCNVSSKEEYQQFLELRKTRSQDMYSIGVHPWDADKISIETLAPYMEQAHCIGEIGMDNVWCTVDLDIQERVFKEQLDMACKLQKPVILHTKGMEDRIVEILKDYPNTYIVHWFSSLKDLKSYIDLDCYFTIGPAVLVDEEIQAIASKVDCDRLLVETDGLAAMDWLFEKELSSQDYLTLMEDTYSYLATMHGVDSSEMKQRISNNVEKALSLVR